jgi:hypothetical protein
VHHFAWQDARFWSDSRISESAILNRDWFKGVENWPVLEAISFVFSRRLRATLGEFLSMFSKSSRFVVLTVQYPSEPEAIQDCAGQLRSTARFFSKIRELSIYNEDISFR